MERCSKAIHLRTGDRGTDNAISAWLEKHGVDVVACADPFEACLVALSRSEPAPDLALVGVDWLAPDELGIVEYFAQAWPGLTLVLYGSPQATARFQPAPLTVVYRSPDALQRVLSESPDKLLARSRAEAAPDEVRRAQPENPGTHARRAETFVILPARAETQDPGREPQKQDRPPGAAGEEETGKTTAAAAPHSILTREELAALLEDDD
jgi:hypothetical protein